jgi:H+-translocating NAD(P) transhydrogenase subunit beta
MDLLLQYSWDIAIIAVFILGIKSFRTPPGARTGNRMAAVALAAAFILLLSRHLLFKPEIVVLALAIGAGGGWLWAMRVNMTQIPAMVAFQNGAGGCAAMLVSFIELTRTSTALGSVNQFFGAVGLIAGAITFSGSMIAAGKLSGIMRTTPIFLPRHNHLLVSVGILICLLGIWVGLIASTTVVLYSFIVIILALSLGILFAVRIGGADMPVLISFLNATTGLAAAFCGIVVESRLLIACGAMVAASGYILTHKMCLAMNRDLKNVFLGRILPPKYSEEPETNQDQTYVSQDQTYVSQDQTHVSQDQTHISQESEDVIVLDKVIEEKPDEKLQDPFDQALEALTSAKSIIIIPGYGMALAQAQFDLVTMANKLEQQEKAVKFAIHPVAGRMPGHMNVLLAEADIDYDKLYDLVIINPEFSSTDVALIVGACDVVNPAANLADNSPISGMPILNAHQARRIIICNLDTQPGYSGVDNPLYQQPNVILILGNAKESLAKLLESLP